ncbi:hypothetical protein [Salmonirosea aquatica]|uniref:Lipocalin-like domain-containing protein n=1 Tax=Salmonirosea aquatica TaxID=2654236 RepID=A0A7C9BQF1_9BACT|nr:hypothetical protein [Cytophagaceae bacterium SJW1-29]
MKRYLYIFLLPLLLLNCKKESEPAPLPAIEEIVGKWRLDAVEKTVNGQKVWEQVSGPVPIFTYYLVFRFDGVILGEKGLSWCCSPETLIVNGTSFKIKPKAKVPTNPQCAYVDCISCPSWDLEQRDNELILTSACEFLNYRHRYLRE